MSHQLQIKVLGSGCASCQTAYQLIESVLTEQQVDAALEKVEDLQLIMSFGVMTTPAIVVNGVVVHAGSIPKRDTIKEWLTTTSPCGDSETNACCDSDSANKEPGCCGSDNNACC